MDTFWTLMWRQYNKHILGRIALLVVLLFCLVGIYAPFLASSKPFFVSYNDEWYFPLFRYLFYRGFYTKGLDIFFNLLIFTFPLGVLVCLIFRRHIRLMLTSLLIILSAQILLFVYLEYGPIKDPAYDPQLSQSQYEFIQKHNLPSWNAELQFLSPYARLNMVLNYQHRIEQQKHLQRYFSSKEMSTLWQMERNNEDREILHQKELMESSTKGSQSYQTAKATIGYVLDKRKWLENQLPLIKYEVMPLISHFHWEEDAGGSEGLNQKVPFWDLTRINRKDLLAALIFGMRISLIVGILSVALALAIGLPIGAFAGYYGGTFDIIVSRFLEIWEAMPTFFMLLMVIAIMQSKSIFLIILLIGIFEWTTFSRYLRGEFFKHRNLPYIESCYSMGYKDSHIIFSHILPNAIPPVLTLLPFAIMGAITSEAGLSFLGLGEEGSCSWGVLMDEGRSAFPSESYLLWPPAVLLTILLVAIALVGDALRDALDPKTHR